MRPPLPSRLFRLVLTASILATGAACAPSAPTGERPPAASSAAPLELPVRARVHMGHLPCGVLVTPTRVWVSNYGDDTVQWIDPATNQAGPPIAVGHSPCGLAVGAGSVWVENYQSDTVTRLDAGTGAVQATIGVGRAPYDVTFTAGAAWVTDWGSGTVSRIDATTNRRTAITTGGNPTGIVAAAGRLWVALGGAALDRAGRSYTIAAIAPANGAVTDRLNAGQRPTWTATDGTGVWISDQATDSVIRVDATTRTVVGTQRLGAAVPLDGDRAGGAIWVPDKSGLLFRIDPASGRVLGRYRSGVATPFVISGDATSLWAVDYTGTDVVRLDVSTLD
jgi:YVTN family beta-propeller protein